MAQGGDTGHREGYCKVPGHREGYCKVPWNREGIPGTGRGTVRIQSTL